MKRTSSFLLLWIVFCAEVHNALTTTPESCEGRCGNRTAINDQCGCHSECRTNGLCCEDFHTTCPGEHRHFTPTPCDPRDDNETECSLCQSTDEIPDDLIKCGSCENRCGHVLELSFVTCSCDVFCGFHGDCCEDFEQFCHQHFQDYLNVSELYAPEDFECMPIPSRSSKSYEDIDYLMITKCSSDGSDCEYSRTPNIDANMFVPMYDHNRGVHYISGYCAMCNGARNVTPWNVGLKCSDVPDLRTYRELGAVNSTKSLLDAWNSGECSMWQSHYQIRYCYNGVVISICPSSCHNDTLVKGCESGYQGLTRGPKVYKNGYCAACNAWKGSNIFCGVKPAISDRDRPGSFSLTFAFDFDPSKGLTTTYNGEGKYAPDHSVFRCQAGFVLDGSHCIPEVSNITVTINGTVRSELSQELINLLLQNIGLLEQEIGQEVASVMETFGVSHKNLAVFSNLELENLKLVFVSYIQCNCDYSPLFTGNHSTTIERFENEILKNVRIEIIMYLELRNIHLESVDSEIDFEINNITQIQYAISDCTWLVYHRNETSMENESVTIDSTGKTYASGRFERHGDTVIVCEDDLHVSDEEADSKEEALGIISLIFYVISMICLIIRLALQPIIISFQNRQGKLHLQLTIALLITYLMLIIGIFLSGDSDACTTGAVLLAYGFLAAFIWMNIIGVDTWLAFRPSAAFHRADEEERSLIVYYLCGWGIPLLLVAVPLGINYSEVDEKFRPEFGGFRCWYTQRYAMLIYFGVPVAISLLLNIIFFVTTSLNLRRAFKKSVNPSEDHHFGIYVRLFVIMGITWIFGFISAFTGEFVFELIFVVLNALQGFFLFVSFVCNRSVLTEIRKRRQKRKEKKMMNLKQQTSTGSGTGSAALSGSGSGSSDLKKDRSDSKV